MKLLYCDLIAYGGLHTGFNVGMMEVLDRVFQPECIEFYSETEHNNICMGQIKCDHINYFPLKMIPSFLVGGYKLILRDFIGCLYLIKLLRYSKKEDILCIGLAYPFAQFTTFILSKILRHRNVFICHHGELEWVCCSFMPNLSLRKCYFSLEKIILGNRKAITNIILGTSIFNNVKSYFPNINSIVIDLPYSYDYHADTKKKYLTIPLIVGAIGGASNNKGVKSIFELAELLKEYIQTGKLIIKIIGRVDKSSITLTNDLVECNFNSIIPENIFQREIASLHYCLLLRPDATYKFRASGTFHDAVKFQKPYLAFRSSYIQYYNSIQPSSGMIFDNINQIAIYLKQILDSSCDISIEYKKQLEAMGKLKSNLSVERIADSFKNQLIK